MTLVRTGGGQASADSSARRPAGPTVGTAMICRPKVCGGSTTVAQVRDSFRDDHVHAVLVTEQGVLLTVVERDDSTMCYPDTLAREIGTLQGRVIGPDADLEHTWRAMEVASRRRLAVVDSQNLLLGLLCLKRNGRGFCTDADVAARAAEPA